MKEIPAGSRIASRVPLPAHFSDPVSTGWWFIYPSDTLCFIARFKRRQLSSQWVLAPIFIQAHKRSSTSTPNSLPQEY